MSDRYGFYRFMDIATKAERVVDSVETSGQMETAYRYIKLACNEMSDTEYYLSGHGDREYNRTCHLFTKLDKMILEVE